MNTLAKAVMGHVFDRGHRNGDLERLPATYRNTRGGFVSRIAAGGLLRLALRWPGLAVFVILAMVVARAVSSRPRRADIPLGPRPR